MKLVLLDIEPEGWGNNVNMFTDLFRCTHDTSSDWYNLSCVQDNTLIFCSFMYHLLQICKGWK
jgi:hypothetical protein